MSEYPVVRGYRIQGDPPKPDKQISTQYLLQKPEAAQALTILRAGVRDKGANCVGKEEFFSGDALPSDRDAALACASCPVKDLCADYAEKAHVAYGVFAGKVYGRGLMEDLEKEEADD